MTQKSGTPTDMFEIENEKLSLKMSIRRVLNAIFSFALIGEKTDSVANTFAELLSANCNSNSSSNSSSQGCTTSHSLNSSNREHDTQQNQPSSL